MPPRLIVALAISAALALAGCSDKDEPEKAEPFQGAELDRNLYTYTPPAPPPPAVVEPPPQPAPAPPPPVVKEFKPLPLPPPPKWPDPAPDLDEQYAQKILLERISSRPSWGAFEAPAGAALPAMPLPAPEWELIDDKYKFDSEASGLPVDNGRTFAHDRWIAAILENTINSQVPGSFVLQTIQDVFGYHQRNILIPKGSRIVCDYEPLSKYGETRLTNKCTRILRGQDRAELYQISTYARDAQGGAGLIGDVDNRVWERYGSAVVISTISALAAAGSGISDNAAMNNAGIGLNQSLAEVTAKILEQSVNLAPVVRVVKGTIVYLKPDEDWILTEPREKTARKETKP